MDDIDDDDEIVDLEVFDTSQSKVEYSRSRDTKRVSLTVRDPAGISEMKLYLILCLEIEKLERRLGISDPVDDVH